MHVKISTLKVDVIHRLNDIPIYAFVWIKTEHVSIYPSNFSVKTHSCNMLKSYDLRSAYQVLKFSSNTIRQLSLSR